MRKLRNMTALASCIGLAFACSSSPEPQKRDPGLMDPDVKSDYDKDAEEQRLSKMMAVRVIDTATGEVEEWADSSTTFGDAIAETCGGLGADQDCTMLSGCAADVCGVEGLLCVSETILGIVSGQGDVTLAYNGTTYRVPPQSAATNTYLTKVASFFGYLGGPGIADSLLACAAEGALDVTPNNGSATNGEVLAAAITEQYFYSRTAFEQTAQNSIAAGDDQLGSTSLKKLAGTRAFAGSQLSRTAAAHALLGGTAGFVGSPDPMCSSNRLSPAALAAKSILRESGLPPDYLLGFEPYASRYGVGLLDTSTLLNSPSLPLGSVGARLAYFIGTPLQGTVQAHYNLQIVAFEEARVSLAEEFVALSRSRTARLPTTSGPGAAPSAPPVFEKYAATATAPPSRPAAYYGALTRTNAITSAGQPNLGKGFWRAAPFDLNLGNGGWLFGNVDIIDGDINVPVNWSSVVREYLGIVDIATSNTQVQAASSFPAILGALAAIDQAQDSAGILLWCESAGARTLTVAGRPPTENLVVVRGEDAMACATRGGIEGAPCADDYERFPITTPASPPTGYHSAVSQPAASFFDEADRYYLLAPNNPGGIAGVGNAHALIGFVPYQLGNGQSGCVEVPIIPSAEKAVKGILEPNPENCSATRTDCAGGSFDDRIPLEDELSSDGDDTESSWKHYLAIAKTAAQESDRLGDEYVNSTIGSLARDEEIDLRRIARDERVSAELDTLQNICGTSIDPSTLFKALGMDANGQTNAGSGVNGQPCPTPLPEGSYCLNGHLVTDWTKYLASSDSEVQKLAACLNDFGRVSYTHMGDEPLCAWETPNGFCADIPEGESCPKVGQTCNPPPNATQTLLLESYLNFFDTSKTLPPPPTDSACTAIRRIREGVSSDVEADLALIRKANIFQPLTVKEAAKKIRLELDFGDYVSVSAGKQHFFTGSAAGGPQTTQWPCAPSGADACGAGNDSSLFCSYQACDGTLRAFSNSKLYHAGIAALVLAGDDLSTVELPAYDLWNSSRVVQPTRRVLQAVDPNTNTSFTFEEDANDRWRRFYVPLTPPAPFKLHSFGADSDFRIPDDTPYADTHDGITFTPYRTGDLPLGTAPGAGIFFSHFSFLRLPLRSERLFPGNLWEGLNAFRERRRADYSFAATPLASLLLGESGSASKPWFDTYAEHSETHEIIGRGYRSPTDEFYEFGGGYQRGNFATPRLVIDPGKNPEAILDGLELLCVASTDNVGARQCRASNAPVLQSTRDLEQLGSHLQCMGDSITQDAVFTIFKNVPNVALQPLIQSQDATGEYGVAVSSLRSALLDISTAGPSIGRELRNFGQDLKELKHTLEIYGIHDQMEDVKFMAKGADTLAECLTNEPVVGLVGGELGFVNISAGINNIVTCANAIVQLGFAEQLLDLSNDETQAQRAIAVADFNRRYTDHITAIELEGTRMTNAVETAARSIVIIDNLKQAARRSLSKALWLSTRQSEATVPLNTGFDRRKDTARVRYEAAHTNAKRAAFLARRAVEQRIGMSLNDMTNDLPLVDAPATWANGICATSGINYAKVSGDGGNTSKNFADSYIGNYVTKLENVVESYRLENNFHEGTDTTLVSVRDDLFQTRSACEVDSINLLREPLGFDRPRSVNDPENPSWHIEGCLWQDVLDGEGAVIGRESPNCLDVVDAPDFDSDGQPDQLSPFEASFGQVRPANGKHLRFGGPDHCNVGDVDCGFQADARLVQTALISPGQYRFSFHGRNTEELNSSRFVDMLRVAGDGVTVLDARVVYPAPPGWTRAYALFEVSKTTTVEVGVAAPMLDSPSTSRVADEVMITAPQLDRLQRFVAATEYDEAFAEPAVFEVPDAHGKITRIACEDTNGDAFRSVAWDRGCVKLCPNGYSSTCQNDAVDHCYWETSFQLSQRAWENGEVFGQGGFARGNFNYRIDDIGLNFVGTGLRNCDNVESPTSCYANGYLPYSLYHTGPFFVRNHAGNDFEALLFDGKIEHARGLAAERYISNPLSATDSQLITPYVRQEFRGRPLDGMFRIRIWDEEGVDFNQLQDVQLLINYRYWTRFN